MEFLVKILLQLFAQEVRNSPSVIKGHIVIYRAEKVAEKGQTNPVGLFTTQKTI